MELGHPFECSISTHTCMIHWCAFIRNMHMYSQLDYPWVHENKTEGKLAWQADLGRFIRPDCRHIDAHISCVKENIYTCLTIGPYCVTGVGPVHVYLCSVSGGAGRRARRRARRQGEGGRAEGGWWGGRAEGRGDV